MDFDIEMLILQGGMPTALQVGDRLLYDIDHKTIKFVREGKKIYFAKGPDRQDDKMECRVSDKASLYSIVRLVSILQNLRYREIRDESGRRFMFEFFK